MLTGEEERADPPDAIAEPGPSVQGHVDGCAHGAVHGWAWIPADPGVRCVVELAVGDAVVGDGIAAVPRADLGQAGMADGGIGFSIGFDAAFRNTAPEEVRVQVRVRTALGPVVLGELLLSRAELGTAPAPRGPETWPPPSYPIASGTLIGVVDQLGPHVVHAWGQDTAAPSRSLELRIWEDGADKGGVSGRIWRRDLEELRQGDGRWGMDAAPPAALADGRIHTISLRLPDGTPVGPPIIHTRFAEPGHAPPRRRRRQDEESASTRWRPERTGDPATILFSIVAVFYNMGREAARTLHSLSRNYQRGVAGLGYEVLVVDNGSSVPLDAEWVRGFGPEFRLVTPSQHLTSPCLAINEAAAQSSGQHVCVMIDGAHILTPGALREVWDAVSEAPDALVGLRQWFVGGDQRWLARCGYTREQEDMLFDRIAWPEDGYRLFSIGTPIWESPNHWFDGLIESNCLFVPRPIWNRTGGMDEKFDEAGAGYANLDLFRRAAECSTEPVVTLLGEATFHQFHDGTTTNVSYETKEDRVRRYENKYAYLKGRTFAGVEPLDIRVRGQLHTLNAMMARQRPLSPAQIGVTDAIRPGELALHFDMHAQKYAQSAYVECGLHERATWMGEPLGMAPSDAIVIQELIVQLRPERIVTVNASAGLLSLCESVLRLLGDARSRIIASGEAPTRGLAPNIVRIEGDAAAEATLSAVLQALGTADTVLVIYTPGSEDRLPIDAIMRYAQFVTLRSYFVFNRSALGQPWLGYSTRWFAKAIRLLTENAAFAVDPARNPHLITTSPMGYLQRVGPTMRLDVEDGGSLPTGLD